MKQGYKKVREAVNQFPLLLPEFPKKMQEIAERMLPYSIGLEFECIAKADKFHTEHIKDVVKREIPYLLDFEYTVQETKFRIPNGIKGLICLYKICNFLKKNYCLNESAGIHYHVDFSDITTDSYFIVESFSFKYLCGDHGNWIIKALEKWNYSGRYNNKGIYSTKGGWVTICFYRHLCEKMGGNYYGNIKQTVEFRIGTMEGFEYSKIVKKAINVSNICRRLKHTLVTDDGFTLKEAETHL